MLASLQGHRDSLAVSSSPHQPQHVENAGSGPFSLGKGPGQLSHLEPCGGKCLFAPGFFPLLGKPSLLAEGKPGFSGSARKNKQGWLCWRSGKFTREPAERPELQLLLQGLLMCLERKQPLVLATGIQVSPLPGECPDPRALESCSLLPSGASGLDLMDFFFP